MITKSVLFQCFPPANAASSKRNNTLSPPLPLALPDPAPPPPLSTLSLSLCSPPSLRPPPFVPEAVRERWRIVHSSRRNPKVTQKVRKKKRTACLVGEGSDRHDAKAGRQSQSKEREREGEEKKKTENNDETKDWELHDARAWCVRDRCDW